ncbi:pentatricopeptide repeat-containing protein, partial [Tanacetum coccineum]
HVIPAGDDSFEVRSDSDAFKVDLSTRTCSCKMSQLSGLPCVHAIFVIFKINRVPQDYVQNWFRKHLYYATYHNYLGSVGGIDLWHNQSQYLKVLPPKHKTMLGRPKKKRIRIGHEGGSGTRVSKVSGQVTCQKCFQVDHNKRGCNAPHVQKPIREKKKVGRPRKGDATDVVGFANPLGGSASGVGRSANPLGGSASGVGRSANPLGRSASGLGSSANPLDGSATNFDRNASDVGGCGSGVGSNASGLGRGSDTPRLKWSPPHRRAFNRIGGISFSTRPIGSQQNRPRQQKEIKLQAKLIHLSKEAKHKWKFLPKEKYHVKQPMRSNQKCKGFHNRGQLQQDKGCQVRGSSKGTWQERFMVKEAHQTLI